MGLPQIIWIVMCIISVIATAYLQGKGRSANFKYNAFSRAAYLALVTAFLYWGGFFGS